jgi:beta-ketoacyl-acyl-carrier-protein synthase I
VYSILMMQHDFIAPNINIDALDEDSQKLHIITHTTQQRIRAFLSNSFGFGGTNSAIIMVNAIND